MLRTVLTLPLLTVCAMAQDPRGFVSGTVLDSSGAVIPNASVAFTQVRTGVTLRFTTNGEGIYEANYLPTGEYSLAAEFAGFKKYSRTGIDLRIGERLRIDITLEPGDASEKIQVTAESPVLETTNATVGQVIDRQVLANMPIRSGSVSWLYSLAPGTTLASLPYDGPWNIDQSSAVRVGGSGLGGVDYNVDGVSNNSYGGRTAFIPPADMVEEVRVDTSSYDAAVGHTTGGQINISMKSGGNALHGTLGAFVASGPMMTRNFFTNGFIFNPATGPITDEKIKSNTPFTRWLRYSAAVGGPVWIPKIYNGRNRTFWMFGYQAHNRLRTVASQASVPTEAMRNGDFSALLAAGPAYQIFDPFSITQEGARFRRQPVPGNIVPRNRISADAARYVKYFPLPNAAGTIDFTNNYQRARPDKQDLYQPIVRIDHVLNDQWRMFGRYSQSTFYGSFDQWIPDSNVRGRKRQRPYKGVALDTVGMLSSTLTLDVRYGWTWFSEKEAYVNQGYDLSEFGFPASLTSRLDPRGVTFPLVTVNGMLPLGNNGGFDERYYTHSLLSVLNWTRGKHSLKFGFDGRLSYDNSITYGNVAPALTFGDAFTRGPLDNSPGSPGGGQNFASLLYGIPTAGGVDINDSRAEFSPFHSLFVQDDWRMTKTFTLNLGLRWEYEGPIRERYDRTSRDFDFVTTNPIETQARANYARAPIPEIAAANFRTPGGLTFAGRNGVPRELRPAFHKAFMPRIGFAWNLRPRVVIRAGYGIFYSLLGADFSDVSQPGFNRRTNIVASNDNGITYAASLTNPFPAGVDLPEGASQGLTTFLGRSPGFYAADGRRGYTQRWSYNLQFEPFARTVAEIGYQGNRATRLRVGTDVNPIPRQYLSNLPVRDNNVINFLTGAVTNPFRGIEGFRGTAFFANANTTRAQLLRPLPHFGSMSPGLPAGSSWYHALTARIERRFAQGMLLQANYTWSKAMEAVAYLEPTDPAPTHVISDLDRSHRFTFAGLYELPFGRGKRFGSQMARWLDYAAGGWQIQALYQGQTGAPLGFGNVIYNGTYGDLVLPNQSLQQWFNTAGFERRPAFQLEQNIRTFPLRLANIRSYGINVWDMSVQKNFQVHEKLKVQLRGEAEGAMNTPNFSPPNTAPTNTLFGQVVGTQTGQEERRIFVGLKLMF
ncbi:MAG: TonB-dependent receptor [Bryobacterales bacterium]|nr:TonB-dependent receptor [Bryobacterales bacterium]